MSIFYTHFYYRSSAAQYHVNLIIQALCGHVFYLNGNVCICYKKYAPNSEMLKSLTVTLAFYFMFQNVILKTNLYLSLSVL